MSVKELTRGEKLLIARTRKGESMRDAAKRLKVDLKKYSAMEAGEEKGPDVKVGKIGEHELCVIQRRRSGLSTAEVATKLKRCRWWIRQMERGTADCAELAEFWKKRKK